MTSLEPEYYDHDHMKTTIPISPLLYAIALLIIIVATQQQAHAAKNCTYSTDPGAITVQWTGFKTNDKIAVHGKFTSVKNLRRLEKSYTSLPQLLKAAAVEVDMLTVDTAAPPRDETLKEFFFKKLKGKFLAIGTLTQIKANQGNTGSASMNLKFNDQTKRVPVEFKLSKEGLFTLNGKMDLANFTAHEALQSLNKACFDLHKGPDGVSKTWSEVEFTITTKINESCK